MLSSKGYANKKKVSSVLVLLFVFLLLSIPAFGESIDYSKMDYHSLLALKQEVDLELHSRPEAAPLTLNPGQYSVGSDIKAGKYYVIYAKPGSDVYCRFHIYADKATYDAAPSGRYGEYLRDEYIEAIDQSTVFELQEGNYLYIEGASLKFSVIDFDDDDYFSYEAPNETIVPLGTYTIGEEIPAGSFTAYPYDLKGATIYIYKNAEAFAADDTNDSIYWDADPKIHVSIAGTKSSPIFKLSEGNIVIIDNAVVMKKNAALFFGD